MTNLTKQLLENWPFEKKCSLKNLRYKNYLYNKTTIVKYYQILPF
jgi:hypothetical protein